MRWSDARRERWFEVENCLERGEVFRETKTWSRSIRAALMQELKEEMSEASVRGCCRRQVSVAQGSSNFQEMHGHVPSGATSIRIKEQ